MKYPLPVLHPDFQLFGTPGRPIRPSRAAKLIACPMKAILSALDDEEDVGNSAAQTGNVFHAAIAAYHSVVGTDQERIAAGLEALALARQRYPGGNEKTATAMFNAYSADEENSRAEVIWVEKKVRLVLPPAATDPTGQDIVIEGTLDQVRRHVSHPEYGTALRVWDAKSGSRFDPDDTLLEYYTQQAVYTLAARSTLDPAILPGGVLYIPGYKSSRMRKRVAYSLDSVDWCWALMPSIADAVASIRRGETLYKPSVDNCKFCDVGVYPKCLSVTDVHYASSRKGQDNGRD